MYIKQQTIALLAIGFLSLPATTSPMPAHGRVTDKLNEITSSANTAGDVVNNAVNAAGTVQSEWDQLKSEFKPRGVETRKISKTGIVNAGKHIGAAGDIVNDVSNAVNNLESGIGNFVDEFKL